MKITRFEKKILDKQERRLKRLDGIAMLLVDVDYDGKIFDMTGPYSPKILALTA